MSVLPGDVATIGPAIGFLLTGVPLAALLDRIGCFEAAADALARRRDTVPVGLLWFVAAFTTVVLNLDTTVVLLTPLYIRIGRRSGGDDMAVAIIPLVLASLASSVLPVSNLTTLLAVSRFDLGVVDVVRHMAIPGLVAVLVGWLVYRRRYPTHIALQGGDTVDERAVRIGIAVVLVLLVAFTLGPAVGIEPWMAALAVDVVLIAVTRAIPWRSVPVVLAVGVLGVALVVHAVGSPAVLTDWLGGSGTVVVARAGLVSVAVGNVINNVPATLLAVDATVSPGPGFWAWLLGVNTGAALVPIGSLANLLWWRTLRVEGVAMDLRRYVRVAWPIVVPSLVAALVAAMLNFAVGFGRP